MRARHWMLAAAMASMSCGRTRASVVVHVVTDMTWGADGDVKSIRVRVYSGEGDRRTVRLDYRTAIGRGVSEVQFPVRVGVLPLDDDTSRVVTVEAAACGDSVCSSDAAVLVEQRAIFSFIEGEQRELPMFLASRCRGVQCDALRTCGPLSGSCQTARVSGSDLPASARDAFAGQLGDGAHVDAVVDAPADRPTQDQSTPVDVAQTDDRPDVTSSDVVSADLFDTAPPDVVTVDRADVVTPDDAPPDVRDVPDATVTMDVIDVPDVSMPLDRPDVPMLPDVPDVPMTADVRDVATPPDMPDVATPPVDVPRMCGTQVCRSIEGCCTALGNACGCAGALGCIARGLPLCL